MKLIQGYHYLPVSDLYESAKWYSNHLGFFIVFEDPIYLELRSESGIRIMLIPNEKGVNSHMKYSNGHQASIGFIVSDFDNMYEYLVSAGIKLGGLSEYQGKSISFYDPDGNRIELWSDYIDNVLLK